MSNETVIDSDDLKAWIVALGSMPVKRIAHKDFSVPYEMNMAHVYELENGKYALVTEQGCSCYSADRAVIDLFPALDAAMNSFTKWAKENKPENR